MFYYYIIFIGFYILKKRGHVFLLLSIKSIGIQDYTTEQCFSLIETAQVVPRCGSDKQWRNKRSSVDKTLPLSLGFYNYHWLIKINCIKEKFFICWNSIRTSLKENAFRNHQKHVKVRHFCLFIPDSYPYFLSILYTY